MLFNILSLLVACALVTADDGYVTLPITRVPVSGNSTHHVTKNIKLDIASGRLLNYIFEYRTFINIGKDDQWQGVVLDTGSSDLWVYSNGTGAEFTYDPSNAQYVNDGFAIRYLGDTKASGDFYKDTVNFASSNVELQFGVSRDYSSESPLGIFGIGPMAIEGSRYGRYPNFPVALKNAGKIQSAAYSLYLGDVNYHAPSIVFGAVDTSRYTGTLKLLPFPYDSNFYVDFEVFNHKLNGALDSGTSLTTLPDSVVSQIADYFGATWDANAGGYKAPTTIPEEGLTYTFGGIPITVPASELWLQLVPNSEQYYLTILPYSRTKNKPMLGDSFLRSAYVVYDLDSHQVAIAQANWNPGQSNYELITSSGIPGAQ